MKEIKAVIQPFMLERVLETLHEVEGLPGVTVSDVAAVSMEQGQYVRIVKTRLEVIVPDQLVERVVGIIADKAHTGNVGDGRIFVIPITETVKIRTGERWTQDP